MRFVLLLLAVVALATLPTAAQSVVPPKECGTMSVSGKRYQVKVDQISCADGRGFVKTYIGRHAKPKGYTCRDFTPKRNRVRAYCNNGRRVFFAIWR